MSKQTKLTKSARGQDCQIRIPGICNFNPETTVLCHLGGGGMGMKSSDIHSAYGCSACHDAIDHRASTEYTNTELHLFHYEGMVRTQVIMLNEGLIKI